MELVLDASVIIKWFLPEMLSQKAIELRKKHLEGEISLCASPLLAFEIINALCTKSGVDNKAIKLAIEVFYQTEIKEYSLREHLVYESAKIAKNYKTSFYDASYIALAKHLNCQFITADKKLYQKVKTLEFANFFI